MSIATEINGLTASRNTIREKMVAAGQASNTDNLATLATNLDLTATNNSVIKLTQDEYNALSDEEKNDPDISYYITDALNVSDFSAYVPVLVSKWSSTKTTINDIGYYTYDVPLSSIFTARPKCELAPAGVLPTETEINAFSELYFSTIDSDTKIYRLYARNKINVDFAIYIDGVSV